MRRCEAEERGKDGLDPGARRPHIDGHGEHGKTLASGSSEGNPIWCGSGRLGRREELRLNIFAANVACVCAGR
eukprot:scaffold69899_cov35-Tisochrysis_lutea.AAC.4